MTFSPGLQQCLTRLTISLHGYMNFTWEKQEEWNTNQHGLSPRTTEESQKEIAHKV
jgi:hypothetical protein